jgi:hypothetical protein
MGCDGMNTFADFCNGKGVRALLLKLALTFW